MDNTTKAYGVLAIASFLLVGLINWKGDKYATVIFASAFLINVISRSIIEKYGSNE